MSVNGDGEQVITLFYAMKELIPDCGDEQKQMMGSMLLLLLACAEDSSLNMSKVADLATDLGVGFNFQDDR